MTPQFDHCGRSFRQRRRQSCMRAECNFRIPQLHRDVIKAVVPVLIVLSICSMKKSNAFSFIQLRGFPPDRPALSGTSRRHKSPRFSSFFADSGRGDEDADEDDGTLLDTFDNESDWLQAELTLVHAPNLPDSSMDALQTATMICRSLQFVDYPQTSRGLERCFEFFTMDCRSAVTARQGARSVERFVEYGQLAPALQPFMGATRVVLGEGTYTAAKPPLRGALYSFPVAIEGAPILAVQHTSGMDKTGVSLPPITNMVIRLEQQRRPPHQNCWMVREILDVRMAFAGDMGNAHVGG